MELDLLEKYLKSDDSKKMLKKIKYICMSYGRDSFEQNFSVYDGDSQIDYHFYNYGVKLPEDATNYLDFVFTEFADDNIDIIDWGASGKYDSTGYCQLTFLLDFITFQKHLSGCQVANFAEFLSFFAFHRWLSFESLEFTFQ